MTHIIAAMATVLAGSVWVNVWLWNKNTDLEIEVAAQTARVASCNARVMNLLEDSESDATVSDPSLFDVPDRWIVPERNPTGR